MKKVALCFLITMACSVSLFGVSVTIPEEIPNYVDLEVTIETAPGDGEVSEGRLYIVQEGKDVPFYAEFINEEGIWKTVIPRTYLVGEELHYFVEIRSADGHIQRIPQEGTSRSLLLADTTPPQITLISPESSELGKGVEQLVVFRIEEESGISQFEVEYDGKIISLSGVFDDFLSFLVTPEASTNQRSATAVITLVDLYGNRTEQEVTFSLKKAPKGPFFTASADYTTDLDIEYTVNFGEDQNSLAFLDMFDSISQTVTMDFDLGGETLLTAGPLSLALSVTLSDDMPVMEYIDAYPSTIISDYQNILRLWHPWNFANEFTYTASDVRHYENANQFLARISLFDDMISYSFGDQEISFQTETIDKLDFRGSAISLDIPFLSLSIGKGLTDLGLYQASWPENFLGVQVGIDVFDYWRLQTNVSFISSLQGRYDDIIAAGSSPIGTLYDLDAVDPEENMIIGLETGLQNSLFTLSGGLGLTLYVNDASQIIDVTQLASDINTAYSFDISPYLGYIDAIDPYFPLFDYFPVTLGLAGAAVDRELWGVTYGGDLKIPKIGLQGWYHKTDKTYKSLGASVASDIMDLGASWDWSFADFSFSTGYSWVQDNIPDILSYDILPLFGLDFRSTADPTENDIAAISHTAMASVETPKWPIVGTVSFTYELEWETTNTQHLADSIEDSAVKNALLASTKNDTSLTHSADIQWKPVKIEFGDFGAALRAKSSDAYTVYLLEDGETAATSSWDFSYGVQTVFSYSKYKLDLGFEHTWGTLPGTETVFEYSTKLGISKLFFDKIALDGKLTQTYLSSALQEYEISGGLSLDKKFGVLSTKASIDTTYTDSIVDNSDDALVSTIEITGGISL